MSRANGRSSTPPAAPVTVPVRVVHRDLAGEVCHVDGEGGHFLDAGAVAQVAADRHARQEVRGDHRTQRCEDGTHGVSLTSIFGVV